MEKGYEKIWREKRRFILTAVSFAFLFYFLLPVSLIYFPETMNRQSFIPGVTWAWAYAFLQIIMIWLLGWLYHLKAKKLDKLTEQMIQEE
ncbi:DUF485 domain-containing protein [Oceanobacillus alkalisoli]|uniref:DUF485 domain-containing protein n=1 Tax=Oceanobacillus alkalisoli TaxID=2925113 RepID=UPI001EEF79B2|nr:DUF485 domain-containing protein [Oceanobacillus alkalisoli]MCF3943667.1 DUF485 domain-containing protein [Oceanobacillus alkalisoli]MCG5104934.1 DUF485 domain-containing protein [Oceanobacillus alkalisoli]